jgi:hypothetical protein
MHSDHAAVGQKWGGGNVVIALTLKWLVWYLNFTTGFTKNVLLVQKKIKLWMAFCGEKYNRDYAECLKNGVNFLVA